MAKHTTSNSHHEKDTLRQHKEDSARKEAERLLSVREPEKPAEKPTPEPTLEQRLADIDRRGRERAEQEKRQLAEEYLGQAQRRFKRAVSNTSDEEVKKAYEEMQRLEALAGGGSSSREPAEQSSTPTGRIRRSAETLQGEATKIVDFLKKHPHSKAGAISEGTGVDFGQSLSAFMGKYAAGVKLKSTGSKSTTTYSLG